MLRDGDTVELLMGQDPAAEPSREWLDHAHTPAARIAIQRWLAAHPTPQPEQQDTAPGETPAPAPERAPAAAPHPTPQPPAPRPESNAVVDRPGATVRLAGCCTPVPPDQVIGFAVRGGAVTVHRVECAAVARMKDAGRAEIDVRWGDSTECRVTLVAESFGRPPSAGRPDRGHRDGRRRDRLRHRRTPSQQRVRHTYTLQLPDAAHLPALMRAMRNVPGVYDVSRAQHHAPHTVNRPSPPHARVAVRLRVPKVG
ncbi:hypothetical protein GCM10020256_18050 [Streptomyces thermocoprophilus]